MVLSVFYVVLAYLIGSIPTAVWVGKSFYSLDVREHGSGNAGATNTFRILGPKAGVPVLLFDIFKGFMAVRLAYLVTDLTPETNNFVNFQLMLGVAALMGHIFPVFANFKGGKGIATLLGMMIGILPFASFAAVGVFLIVFLSTRIVSISSMLAAVSFPFIVTFVFRIELITMSLFSIFIALLVIVTHRKNIKRLLKKEESKISFKRKAPATQDEG